MNLLYSLHLKVTMIMPEVKLRMLSQIADVKRAENKKHCSLREQCSNDEQI
jgi:hypothetical protein